jgi:hypothetical protein
MRTTGAQEGGHTMRTTGAHAATTRTPSDGEVTTLEKSTLQRERETNSELGVAEPSLTIDQAFLNETGAGFLQTSILKSIENVVPSSTLDHAAISLRSRTPQHLSSLKPNVGFATSRKGGTPRQSYGGTQSMDYSVPSTSIEDTMSSSTPEHAAAALRSSTRHRMNALEPNLGSTVSKKATRPLQSYGGTQSTSYPVLGTRYVLGTSPTDVSTVGRHFNRDSIEMPVLTTSSSTVDHAASTMLSEMARQLRETNFCPAPFVGKCDESCDSCYREQ